MCTMYIFLFLWGVERMNHTPIILPYPNVFAIWSHMWITFNRPACKDEPAPKRAQKRKKMLKPACKVKCLLLPTSEQRSTTFWLWRIGWVCFLSNASTQVTISQHQESLAFSPAPILPNMEAHNPFEALRLDGWQSPQISFLATSWPCPLTITSSN